MRSQGLTYMQICLVLNAHGVPTPMGRPLWQKSYIVRLLHTRYVQDLIEGVASLRINLDGERTTCACLLRAQQSQQPARSVLPDRQRPRDFTGRRNDAAGGRDQLSEAG